MISEDYNPYIIGRSYVLKPSYLPILYVRCNSLFQVRLVLVVAECSGFMWLSGNRPTDCSFATSLIHDILCLDMRSYEITWCTTEVAQARKFRVLSYYDFMNLCSVATGRKYD